MAQADQPLAQALQAEQGSLRAFVQILRDEQAALTDGDLDALPRLAGDKLKLADEVAACAQARRTRVVALGHTPDRSGMQGCLRRHARSECAALWQEIVSLAEAGRTLNELNGLLVERRLADSRQALAVLQGAAAAEGLYDRDGQAHAQGGTRIYGAA